MTLESNAAICLRACATKKVRRVSLPKAPTREAPSPVYARITLTIRVDSRHGLPDPLQNCRRQASCKTRRDDSTTDRHLGTRWLGRVARPTRVGSAFTRRAPESGSHHHRILHAHSHEHTQRSLKRPLCFRSGSKDRGCSDLRCIALRGGPVRSSLDLMYRMQTQAG
jgi:hypothetical protein